VAVVRSDVSEELIAFIIRVTRFSVLQLIVTANGPGSPILSSLTIEETPSSGTSVLAIATRCHIREDGILQARMYNIVQWRKKRGHIVLLSAHPGVVRWHWGNHERCSYEF
jgi:hypothetical protein